MSFLFECFFICALHSCSMGIDMEPLEAPAAFADHALGIVMVAGWDHCLLGLHHPPAPRRCQHRLLQLRAGLATVVPSIQHVLLRMAAMLLSQVHAVANASAKAARMPSSKRISVPWLQHGTGSMACGTETPWT